ncbi:MAG: hypothetical protein HZC47_08145 [Methanobacterium sp.]|nr:hypothetical protein [Methanobacterium sp.]
MGQKVSNNPKFSILLLVLLIILSVTLNYLGNIPSIDQNIDYDDALEIWINHLFSFQYPYDALTQLGQRITPFPSLPLYSIPFYLLGNVAYQDFINLFIILFVIWKFSDNILQRNFGLISLSISTPFLICLLSHSYHITLASFTALGLYLLFKNRFIWGSVIFGLLTASVGYIWFTIPTVIYYIFKKGTSQNFKKSLFIIILIPLIIVLPFIIWNPDIFFHFAPLAAVSGRLSAFKYFDVIVALALAIISLISYKKTNNLFFSVFIGYLIFELILPLRSMFLLALSAILLGVYMDKLKIDTNKISDQSQSD